ncbi:MAG: DUF1573 domain-containing protein [Cytophagaceae bacterium]|nr:DUF1573 domain-containing protein [Cytophagaceae bacterium]
MRLLFLLCFCFISMHGNAQEKYFFLSKEYIFDTLYEGEVSNSVFILKNESQDTLYFHDVRSSCGCLTPFYSREGILPGKCSMVGGHFLSKDRPGTFSKSITVIIGKKVSGEMIQVGEAHHLILKGFVSSDQRPEASIKFNSMNLYAGKISQDKVVYYRIPFKNSGEHGLKISEVDNKGANIDYTYGREYISCSTGQRPFVGNDEVIRAGEEGVIILKLQKKETTEEGKYEVYIDVKGNFKTKTLKVVLEFE